MKPSKLYKALHALIGERVPLYMWGACGVGKSQIVGQIPADLNYDFLDVRNVQISEPDGVGSSEVPPSDRRRHPVSRRADLGTVCIFQQRQNR